METHRYNTFRFFREQFRLPAKAALEWCVVRESTPAGAELRLGVALKGTRLYIDVAMRRFFTQVECGAVSRQCFPAVRTGRKDAYEYRTADGWGISRPKRYIRDIYRTARFDAELLEQTLL